MLGGGSKYSAVLVTDLAVGTDQAKKFVMVVDTSDRVQYREVTVGPEIDGLRVIVKGLAANERIVVNGLQRVRPKDAVKAKTVEMAVGTAETKRPA